MRSRLAALGGSWLLPAVLSTTAGTVDVIGFLALGGLFTAHISGNLCVLAAHYVTGRFSKVGPLLSVPVFIAVLGVVTLALGRGQKASNGSRRALLVLHLALLAASLGLGVTFGPFTDADRPLAVLVGMLAVAAMAIQNALVKLALHDAPATAVMTTNLAVLTMDLATLARGRADPDERARARRRVRMTLPRVVGFVGGCAAGAALEAFFNLWALALPVVLAGLALPLWELSSEGRARELALFSSHVAKNQKNQGTIRQ
jgi:uncharacterized membrane protein YoaK (UPF0700 family)